MSNRLAAAVVAGALAVAALLAAILGETTSDIATIIGVSLGGSLVAGLAGAKLLSALGERSLRWQSLVVALTSVAAVAAGTSAAGAVMFLSPHDFQFVLVILLPAGAVGVVSALMLADRVAVESRALGEAARRMAAGEAPTDGQPLLTEELADVRRELEATSSYLSEARAREQALEASRRELVSWVSHDLRTPLAGIRALVEALEDRVVVDDVTVARYHRTIQAEVDRLSHLVDDLFELSRIHAGSLPLTIERVSLADLLSDTLAGAAPVAEAKGVRLEGSIAGVPPEIDLSAPEVMRVLRNLLDNAIRHTPPAGAVRLDAVVEGEHAVVAVSDACGGIPEADLDRVFDVAFRGDRARTPSENGAGLGLAIARGLVEAHRGNIAVRNAGAGCQFIVRLPLPA
ncbi:MAG: HAMP domain-containing histidine kinase [Actinomycetota bacterium]|nr:HAMP domain-containing histidine kinase [Actinomycetota bacterium]